MGVPILSAQRSSSLASLGCMVATALRLGFRVWGAEDVGLRILSFQCFLARDARKPPVAAGANETKLGPSLHVGLLCPPCESFFCYFCLYRGPKRIFKKKVLRGV